MKKLISLILAIVTVISVLFIFSSCGYNSYSITRIETKGTIYIEGEYYDGVGDSVFRIGDYLLLKNSEYKRISLWHISKLDSFEFDESRTADHSWSDQDCINYFKSMDDIKYNNGYFIRSYKDSTAKTVVLEAKFYCSE